MPKRDRREQIAAYLAERDREGLSYAELAQRTGVRAATLSWWSWRLRKDGRRASAFIAVEGVAEPSLSGAADSGLVVEMPDGLRVRVSRDFDADTLARLVSLLRERC